MTPEQLRLLELLKEIDQICKEHDITYYIDGGTAIGAIRHNGFIPWDDDIDIVMTRKNYDKFVSIIDDVIPKNRKFESMDRNDKYTMVYARYCDRTSTSILRTSMLDVFESGVFIDIFILDPIPNGKEEQEKYLKLFKAYAEYINPYYYTSVVCKDYETIKKLERKEKMMGREKFRSYINEKLFSFDEEDCDNYCFRFDLNPFIYPKRFFEKPLMMRFEDMLAPVPTCIEEYLFVHYGETWMYVPQGDNQEVHNVVINLNVPYETFKNQYIDSLPKDAMNVYKKFHRYRVKNKNLTDTCAGTDLKIRSILTRRRIEENIDSELLKRYYDAKQFAKVEKILEDFYAEQLKKAMIKNGIVLEIEQLEEAIYTLIANGRYYDAAKILKTIPGRYPDLEEMVAVIADLRHAFYNHDREEYGKILNIYSEKYSDTIDFIEGTVLKLRNEDRNEEALKLIEEVSEKYSGTDYIMKYKADIIGIDDKEAADKIYREVLENTNNGMLIQEISQIARA